ADDDLLALGHLEIDLVQRSEVAVVFVDGLHANRRHVARLQLHHSTLDTGFHGCVPQWRVHALASRLACGTCTLAAARADFALLDRLKCFSSRRWTASQTDVRIR